MSFVVTYKPVTTQHDGTMLVRIEGVKGGFTEHIILVHGVNIANQSFVNGYVESESSSVGDVISTMGEPPMPFDFEAGVFDMNRDEDLTIDCTKEIQHEYELLEFVLDHAAYNII